MLWKETLAELTWSDINNFPAIDFLEDFRRDVMPPDSFTWTEDDYTAGKCRQVQKCLWPRPIRLAFYEEIAKNRHSDGRVYFDGTVFSKPKLKQARTAERKSADERPGLCPDARMIQEYMNSRKPHLFTATVDKHYDSALAAAQVLPLFLSREAQTRILRSIYDQPQPFYAASRAGNTVRLVSSESIPNLQSDVRRALTPDWLETDLKSCQLAICASLWNVPCVQSFLETGKSVWSYLSEKLAIPERLAVKTKPILKEAVYSACFGMQAQSLQGMVTKEFNYLGISDAGYRFMDDELIAALLGNR